MHRAHSLHVPARVALGASAVALVVFALGARAADTTPAASGTSGSATTTSQTSGAAVQSQSTTQTTTTAPAAGATTTTSTGATATAPSAQASTEAGAAARAALAKQIEARAAAADAADVEKSTSRMIEAARKVDSDASADAGAKIAGRLATQFHLDASALTAEQQSLEISWGNLMIAHTLSASASDATSASVANLVALHKDGMGWGKIAAGLGFKLGAAVSAVETEGRVAAGQAQANGKASRIGLAASVKARAGDPDAAGADAAARSAAQGAANGAAKAAAHAADAASQAASHAAEAGARAGAAGGK